MLQLRFRVDGVSVLLPTEKEEIGILDVKTASALTSLMAIDQRITFEPSLTWKEGQDLKTPLSKIFLLDICIYGNADKMIEIGSTLSTASLYLQEPLSFSRDFVYRNPHVLSWSSESTPLFLEASKNVVPDLSDEIGMILSETAPVGPSSVIQSDSVSTTLLP